MARLLIGRVAIIDATAERPGLSGRAEVFFLERAKVGCNRLTVRRRVGKEHLGFQIAYKQYVAVLLEAAAPAAGDADRPCGGDFAVDLLVQIQHFSPQFLAHSFCGGKFPTCRPCITASWKPAAT